jgi:hypothetical protein
MTHNPENKACEIYGENHEKEKECEHPCTCDESYNSRPQVILTDSPDMILVGQNIPSYNLETCTCGSDGSVTEPHYDHLTSLHVSRAAMLECDEHYMEVVRRAEKRAVEECKDGLREKIIAKRKDYPFYAGRFNPDAGTSGYNNALSDILAILDNKSPKI